MLGDAGPCLCDPVLCVCDVGLCPRDAVLCVCDVGRCLCAMPVRCLRDACALCGAFARLGWTWEMKMKKGHMLQSLLTWCTPVRGYMLQSLLTWCTPVRAKRRATSSSPLNVGGASTTSNPMEQVNCVDHDELDRLFREETYNCLSNMQAGKPNTPQYSNFVKSTIKH